MLETKKVEEEVNEKVDAVDDDLVDKVQVRLDAINGEDVKEDDADDQQTDDDDSTPDKDQADADDSTSDDKPDKDEDTDETGDTDDKGTKEVQLSDAYYRAAIHQGWTPDEIKEFFEANPELAVKTLAKNHESTNKLNSEFARMGRIKPENKKVADLPTATEANAAASVDMATIKEQYGDDSAIVTAFEIMQTKLDAVRNSFPDKTIIQNDANNIPHNDPMRATVDKFFTDSALKPYVDFYGEGNDTEKLTQGQFKHRHDMLQMAEDIVVGSQAHGRNITVEAAMEAAHLLVSEPVREEAVRKELTATVKRRAKGVTLKPAKSKAAKTVTDGKLSEKQMIAKVEAGLRKVYK